MKIRLILIFAAALMTMTACGGQIAGKSAVVYYSQNGTTAKVAEQFVSATGADLIELKCEVPYPAGFQATIAESQDECANSTGRALVQSEFDLSGYDTIYIGYPIWFGTYAPPIVTFVKDNDLAGKNVVLFCTYGSGGRLASENNFKAMCPDANVLGSYGVSARKVDLAADEVPAFVCELRTPTEKMVGAYSEARELTAADSAVFNVAMADYGYLNLTPVSVSTQVVAGVNYIFNCNGAGPGGQASSCQVLIFKPLDGDPYLKSVER